MFTNRFRSESGGFRRVRISENRQVAVHGFPRNLRQWAGGEMSGVPEHFRAAGFERGFQQQVLAVEIGRAGKQATGR